MADSQIFEAKIADIRTTVTVLRSISFKDTAICVISEKGLRFSVEEARSIQAHAWLERHLFQSFKYINTDIPKYPDHREVYDRLLQEPHTVFQIDLDVLLECLNIFGGASSSSQWSRDRRDISTYGKDGSSRNDDSVTIPSGNVTTCRISYRAPGHPLILLLEENKVVTSCELTTYEPDPPTRLMFDDDQRVQKIIMKSEWLRDALLDVDSTSTKVTFTTYSPDTSITTPTFKLCSDSLMGTSEMHFPNDRDVLETFQCSPNDQQLSNHVPKPILRWSYRSSYMLYVIKGLSASVKTSIRTDQQGLLSLQVMIPCGDGQYSFVEYLIAPLVDEDADEMDNEESDEGPNEDQEYGTYSESEEM